MRKFTEIYHKRPSFASIKMNAFNSTRYIDRTRVHNCKNICMKVINKNICMKVINKIQLKLKTVFELQIKQ